MRSEKILIIGKVWPEPGSSAAGMRMMQLINLFFAGNYKIHFACSAQPTGNEVHLESLGVKTHVVKINDEYFDDFLRSLNPDVVMYDRFMTEEQFGWRVRNVLPETLTLLDTEDLHFLRRGRQDGVKKRGYFQESDYYNETTQRELASILRTDLTLIISKFEMSLLINKFQLSSSKLSYLPIQVTKSEGILPFEERRDVVFIGNFLHEPNWDAVLQLKKIWKDWEQKPKQIHLRIYGAYPPQKAYGLNSEREQFHIIGRANSSKEVIAGARLLIAPLRYGAGLKGKLIEAMQYGTPTITTTVGAEGLNFLNQWGGVVEDDFSKWPAVIEDLFDDKNHWEEQQQTGFKNLEKLNESFKAKEFIAEINRLIENINQHRQENFLGEVLHYHTLRSTEFMSRWIAEKNKT